MYPKALKLTLKDRQEEQRLICRRAYTAGFLIALLLLLLLGRITYLQVFKHKHYTTLSQSNRIKILPIPPTRGLIFSRNGTLLAGNRTAFSLELVPEKIDKLDETIARLSSFIKIEAESIDRFYRLLQGKRQFERVPLKLSMSEEEVARFSARRHNFHGIEIVPHHYRYYPEQSMFAHVLGYVGRIDKKELKEIDTADYQGTTHIGKLGIEKAYEAILHGTAGHQRVEVNVQGRIIHALTKVPPQPGHNLHLSLHLSLQKKANELMQGKRGAIVAIDPNNGDILTLVSSPAYDPNLFVNGIDAKSYRVLLNSKDIPLINRVLSGRYPPGSTIKPFLSIASLELGLRQPEATTWCKGWHTLPNDTHRYRDWETHGRVNLHGAIVRSCDVYFYQLAQDLGIARLNQILTNFGFGLQTGIDLGGESSGLVPSVDWKQKTLNQIWYTGDTLIAGIGQGYILSTPLQLALATAILANQGKRIRPRLVYKTSDPVTGSAKQLPVAEPIPVKEYNKQHWDYVIQAMVDVVHASQGTARRSGENAEYRFAGKTGTAQVVKIGQDEQYKAENMPERLRDHALFIAFAPVAAPQIALAIVVENGGSGSSTAAPLARQLLDHFFHGIRLARHENI